MEFLDTRYLQENRELQDGSEQQVICRSNRVTMKMDVSYTDHSHVIGKGGEGTILVVDCSTLLLFFLGNTIRRVMAETNCHIHFPDSNRSNPNEKSNQVSIAGEDVLFYPIMSSTTNVTSGEIDGVETARARVRELTPLIFCFDLPIISSLHNIPDVNDPYIRAIQDQYNIQVSL